MITTVLPSVTLKPSLNALISTCRDVNIFPWYSHASQWRCSSRYSGDARHPRFCMQTHRLDDVGLLGPDHLHLLLQNAFLLQKESARPVRTEIRGSALTPCRTMPLRASHPAQLRGAPLRSVYISVLQSTSPVNHRSWATRTKSFQQYPTTRHALNYSEGRVR